MPRPGTPTLTLFAGLADAVPPEFMEQLIEKPEFFDAGRAIDIKLLPMPLIIRPGTGTLSAPIRP
jgi:hypothetical protein